MKATQQQPTHTPEPWHYEHPMTRDMLPLDEDWAEYLAENPPITRIVGADGSIVVTAHDLFKFTPENADRIVACVNAMAGVADPASAITAAREALEWTLEQAEAWLGNYTGGPGEDEYREQLQQARAALQQLNGGKQP